MCSSRNPLAFVYGAARLLCINRVAAVFNSLSLDYISATLAFVCEGGIFQEIGKRGVWSAQRQAASVVCAHHGAIALDADMGSLSLLTTYSFTGYQYPTIANIDLYKVDGYHRIDASAIWTSADETISATFFVNNVFDKIGLNEFVAVSGLGEQVFLGMPTNHREMGLTIRYRPSI